MWITVDKTKDTTLMWQIYCQIKEQILRGDLSAGDRLPSSRVLSKELSISRNTIIEAYSQLIAEGYLIGEHGSGTIVATGIPINQSTDIKKKTAVIDTSVPTNDPTIDFCSGVPDLRYFPKKEWGKLFQKCCETLPDSAFRYQSPLGVFALRKTISLYLQRTRGIHCNPENIMIVSGATQALSLVSNVLYQDNKKVIIEDPTHHRLINVISTTGMSLVGIKADVHGLNTDLLEPSPDIAFIYTTPSHQYPLGGILPIQRRLALIQYAKTNNCYVVEDDYDSEFRFEGHPISSVFELNPQKVIYIGSLSKILAPAIRLGYVLLPDELINQCATLKQYTDVHTEAITQYVLSDFIEKGGLDKHVWKMKKIYAKKRQHLINELTHYFEDTFEIMGESAGLHLLVHFKNITFTDDLLEIILLNAIKIYPIEKFAYQNLGYHNNDILLGYAHLDFSDISKGIEILSKTIYSFELFDSIK